LRICSAELMIFALQRLAIGLRAASAVCYVDIEVGEFRYVVFLCFLRLFDCFRRGIGFKTL
ncbi:hypothetical protein, partial [Escherichia coli]|uniref:hypothetical protein n=1 Tax=Escherichia coli TaxID=562 RepID=UPI001BD2BAF4